MKAGLAPQLVGAHALVNSTFESGADVVAHLGAVQSQLHDQSLWGIARRCRPGITHRELAAEFDTGRFIRTHVMRPTWHHVTPTDLPWLLDLTGPRVERILANSNSTIGLTPDIVDQAVAVVATSVAQGPRTRTDIRADLVAAGIDPGEGAEGTQRLAHLMMAAELGRVVCSGPLQGKQHTHAAFDTRVPTPAAADRDEQLAWLATVYGRGHGPFRDVDLAWWSSLTLTDCRRAIDLAELTPFGDSRWSVGAVDPLDVPHVMLLPNFDEFISYARDDADFEALSGTALTKTEIGRFMRASGLVFVEGQLAGWWARRLGAKRVSVEVTLGPGVRPDKGALETEAEAFAGFLERPLELSVSSA